jgi:hypothetical protein
MGQCARALIKIATIFYVNEYFSAFSPEILVKLTRTNFANVILEDPGAPVLNKNRII